MMKKELNNFYKDFQKLFDEAIKLPPNVDSDQIIKMKEKIDKLYERACGLAGDLTKEKEGLNKLVDVIMKNIQSHSTEGDKTAQEELETENIARQTHFDLLKNPLIADLLRPDSLVLENELIATLLCEENEESLKIAINLMIEKKDEILSSSKQRLLEIDSEQNKFPKYWQSLAIMKNHEIANT